MTALLSAPERAAVPRATSISVIVTPPCAIPSWFM